MLNDLGLVSIQIMCSIPIRSSEQQHDVCAQMNLFTHFGFL